MALCSPSTAYVPITETITFIQSQLPASTVTATDYQTSYSTVTLDPLPSTITVSISYPEYITVTGSSSNSALISSSSPLSTLLVPAFTSTVFSIDPITTTITSTIDSPRSLSYDPAASTYDPSRLSFLSFQPGDAITSTGTAFTTMTPTSLSSSNTATAMSSLSTPTSEKSGRTLTITLESIKTAAMTTSGLSSLSLQTLSANNSPAISSTSSSGSASVSSGAGYRSSDVPTASVMTPGTSISQSSATSTGAEMTQSGSSLISPPSNSSPVGSQTESSQMTASQQSSQSVTQSYTISLTSTPLTTTSWQTSLASFLEESTMPLTSQTSDPIFPKTAQTLSSSRSQAFGPSLQSSSSSLLVASSFPASSLPASVLSTPISDQTLSTSVSAASQTATMASQVPDGTPGARITLDFDTLPVFSSINATDITQQPWVGVAGLYHHLAFNGYVYAPSALEPYQPISSPNVAVFLANASGSTVGVPGSNMTKPKPGKINDGTPMNSTFSFDPISAYIGCDDGTEVNCTLAMTGYKWNSTSQNEYGIGQHNASLSGCIGFKDCKLQEVTFPSTWMGLSGMQLLAFVNNNPVMFFVDNLTLQWSDG